MNTEVFSALRRAAEEARYADFMAWQSVDILDDRIGASMYRNRAFYIRKAIRAAIGSPKA